MLLSDKLRTTHMLA